jgi:imidazolonepropionase-like amidohydrolase
MKSTLQSLLVSGIVMIGAANLVASEIPAKPQDHPIALAGAVIHPVSGPDITGGTILFEKGRITAIGTKVDCPPGTEIIDVHGKHIYPGLIDARTNLGLVEIDAVRATNDITETGECNPNIRAEVAINPESELIPVTRANGVTTVLTLPDGGLISGTAAVVNLDGWTWEEMTLRAPVGLVVNWPSMTVRKSWWDQRPEEEQLKARDKALRSIRDAFRDARAYLRAQQAGTEKGIPHHRTDLRWEALAPVLDGKIPVLVNAEELAQIESAVAWANEEHIKCVIMGGYDSPRAASLLKANHIPVIVNPIYRTPLRRWEAYDWQFTIPQKLREAGVRFCIAGDGGASNERNLPYHAAAAVAYGLSREEAIRSITLSPAEICGIADRAGSLEVGKDATLIVTTGDPLETVTATDLEFIRGRKVQLTSKHTRLYEKYKEKYRQ